MPPPAPPSISDDPNTGPRLELIRFPWPEVIRRLWPTLRPFRFKLALGCAGVAVAGGVYGLMPLFAKYLFDEAIPQRSIRLALIIAGAFVATHLIRMVVWYFAMRMIMYTQEQVTFAFRTLGFAHLQRLSLRFHSQYPSGFLYQSVFGTAINAIGGAMQTVIKQLSLYIVALLTSLVACLWLSVPMTGVILLGSVAYVVVGRLTGKRIYSTTRESNEAQNIISDFIVDRLRGTRTIQAMSLEEEVQADFEKRLWPTQLKTLAATMQNWRLSIMTQVVDHFVTAAIMVAGAASIFYLDLTLGDLVAFMGYQATFILVVSTLTNTWGSLTAARAGADQLLTVLATPAHVENHPDAAMPETIKGDLTFDHISFGYNENTPVLQDLDLHIKAGQTVALVGGSGSGKTTIANLLLRFFDPDHGRLLLDGTDVRQLPMRHYRALFGVVLQDPFLFNASVRANLRYAKQDATEQQMIDALKQARAWEFVEALPAGLDTVVGESGGNLSGGQRQRLAIARCLLLQTRFVILDEPTSALDVVSEQAVQEAFESLLTRSTVFIIAHRLSTIRSADRILVLDHGKVVQDGHYDTLVTTPGPFRTMYELTV